APRERVAPGLDQVRTGGAGDDELVGLAVDAEERTGDTYRREGGPAARFDDDDLTAGERVDELRPRHARKGRGRADRAGARVRQADLIVPPGLEVPRVEHRPIGARDEDPV